jgi:hypothetical protein
MTGQSLPVRSKLLVLVDFVAQVDPVANLARVVVDEAHEMGEVVVVIVNHVLHSIEDFVLVGVIHILVEENGVLEIVIPSLFFAGLACAKVILSVGAQPREFLTDLVYLHVEELPVVEVAGVLIEESVAAFTFVDVRLGNHL